jgi:hypothetical protein
VSLGEVAVVVVVVVKIVVFLPDSLLHSYFLLQTILSFPLISRFATTVTIDCGTVLCCVDNTAQKLSIRSCSFVDLDDLKLELPLRAPVPNRLGIQSLGHPPARR